MVAEMGLTSAEAAKMEPAAANLPGPRMRQKSWSVSVFVKPMVQSSVETLRASMDTKTITLQVMDDSKNDSPNGIAWTKMPSSAWITS